MQNRLNVKKGDSVIVITGKDSGKKGKVLACYPAKNRIVVEKVNMIKRHKKPRSAQDKGGIIEREGTIDVSNVMLLCPVCGKPTRIKNTLQDGKKVRVCKCGAILDKKYTKPTKKTVANKTLDEKNVAQQKDDLAKTEEKKISNKKKVEKVSESKAKKELEKNGKSNVAPKSLKATTTNKTVNKVNARVKKGDV